MYALDTNIISLILRGDKGVKQRWRQEESEGNRSVIPLIVYYEVRRGLLANDATSKMRAFEELCATLGVDNLTVADMNTASSIYAEHKNSGTLIDDTDILIAAQCITHGHILVTNNTRHFERIEGLQLVDWIEQN
jgi:predicted nucleic acid-binding protein